MDVESFRTYCLGKKGVTEGFPFDSVTLVFKVMGKMFALLSLDSIPSSINLKCDPERSIELRETYDGLILPGYHMSKIHWNTIAMEQLPDSLVRELTDLSYELIIAGLTKKLKTQLDQEA